MTKISGGRKLGPAGTLEQNVTVSAERLFLQSVYQSRLYPMVIPSGARKGELAIAEVAE